MPPSTSFLLLAGAFARRLRLLHPFSHLGFHCVEIEARAFLHRRVIEKGLDFRCHSLARLFHRLFVEKQLTQSAFTEHARYLTESEEGDEGNQQYQGPSE